MALHCSFTFNRAHPRKKIKPINSRIRIDSCFLPQPSLFKIYVCKGNLTNTPHFPGWQGSNGTLFGTQNNQTKYPNSGVNATSFSGISIRRGDLGCLYTQKFRQALTPSPTLDWNMFLYQRLFFMMNFNLNNNICEIQSWKKLHAVRVDIFSRIEDIFVQKSRTYIAILDLCIDFA